MKYVTEFAVPIWSGQYNLQYDYEAVQKKCEELGSGKIDLTSYEEFQHMYKDILIRIDAICNSIDRRFNLYMGDANIIINRPKTDIIYDLESTMIFMHWIRASKNTGRITYYSNSLLEHSKRFNSYESQLFSTRTESKPVTGKINVFPSWLPHSIEESTEDDQNITLEIPLYQYIKE
jgi:hypothetical protein